MGFWWPIFIDLDLCSASSQHITYFVCSLWVGMRSNHALRYGNGDTLLALRTTIQSVFYFNETSGKQSWILRLLFKHLFFFISSHVNEMTHFIYYVFLMTSFGNIRRYSATTASKTLFYVIRQSHSFGLFSIGTDVLSRMTSSLL